MWDGGVDAVKTVEEVSSTNHRGTKTLTREVVEIRISYDLGN